MQYGHDEEANFIFTLYKTQSLICIVSVIVGKMSEKTTIVYERKLPFTQRLAYSVGHVLNDLTASVWFSYLIVYFHQVKNFDNALAGYLMLIGQVSDALFTPFVGIESDRTVGIFRMGRRKSWHFVGQYLMSLRELYMYCLIK